VTAPPAARPEDSVIVRRAIAVSKELGLPVSLQEGSTDANIPMSLGIPAITINGGGTGKGAHSLGETFDTTDTWKGTQRAPLLTVALAEPQPGPACRVSLTPRIFAVRLILLS
jgi:hypothetical protein